MIQITDKTKCCGCTACSQICPRSAIRMTADEEGFLYPNVDEAACVECGLCEMVCPIQNPAVHEEQTKGYIVRHSDENIVQNSTSGGGFTAIAEHFFNMGAVVYGAGYDDEMNVVCRKASSMEEAAEMRGSKFVQSRLGNTFQEIRQLLKEGQKVVFTGTPCQTAGLVHFLRGKPKGLFCIDIVCRGVPSPELWRNYLNMMEQKYRSKVVDARFKNKTYGYHAATMKVTFENGRVWYGSGRIDPMMKAFVSELASRPSCGSCSFKTKERVSDLTMFDCYRFTEVTGLADDNKGYTSILTHTEQGEAVIAALSENMTILPADADLLIEKNGIMVYHSAKPHPRRSEFYQLVQTRTIDEAMNAISPITGKDHLVEGMKGVLYRTGMIQRVKKLRKKKTIQI